jgi:hypothetical protein
VARIPGTSPSSGPKSRSFRIFALFILRLAKGWDGSFPPGPKVRNLTWTTGNLSEVFARRWAMAPGTSVAGAMGENW